MYFNFEDNDTKGRLSCTDKLPQLSFTALGVCVYACNNVMADHCHIFWFLVLLDVVKEISSILGFNTESNF